jgi:hypothetical protein
VWALERVDEQGGLVVVFLLALSRPELYFLFIGIFYGDFYFVRSGSRAGLLYFPPFVYL